jgi:hypothetical protein
LRDGNSQPVAYCTNQVSNSSIATDETATIRTENSKTMMRPFGEIFCKVRAMIGDCAPPR